MLGISINFHNFQRFMSEHKRQQQKRQEERLAIPRVFFVLPDNELEPEIQHASAVQSMSDCPTVSLSLCLSAHPKCKCYVNAL